MSLFTWFQRKPTSRAKVGAQAHRPSSLMGLHAASQPVLPGQRSASDSVADAPKSQRMERRELLYAVVRDAMVRVGVLSASYKFKVLSLDQRGQQFLVMIDLASEYGGSAARLAEMEALIAQTAKTRFDILVTAVYWRTHETVAVGVPARRASDRDVAQGGRHTMPERVSVRAPLVPPRAPSDRGDSGLAPLSAMPTEPAAPIAPLVPLAPLAPVAQAASPAPLVPTRAPAAPASGRFDPIEADEVAAFKKALASLTGKPPISAAAQPGVPVRSGPLLQSPLLDVGGFADTDRGGLPASDLSATQYGDLR